MAYEPKEWACGEVVTADALNHLEGGVADANAILPEATSADNGKVLGVSNGEYALTNTSEPTFSTVTLTGGYAFKYGKLAIVTYTKDGISFPSMMNGGLKPLSGGLTVDESVLNGVSMPVLGYGVDANDATKKYAVTYGTTPQGKAFFLIDNTGNSPSGQVFFWGTFFVPCV